MLPARIKREAKPGTVKRVRCPAHLKWVREHHCCVPGCHEVPIEAAHVRTGTGGGMGIKPGDQWAISLCADHHRQQHQIGEPAFEKLYGIDLKALAREFAAKSSHRRKLGNG